jgi:hypothetical protein
VCGGGCGGAARRLLGNWNVFHRQQKARGHEYARVLRYVGGRRTQRLFTAWRQLADDAALAAAVFRARRRGPRTLLAAWARVGRTAATQYRRVKAMVVHRLWRLLREGFGLWATLTDLARRIRNLRKRWRVRWGCTVLDAWRHKVFSLRANNVTLLEQCMHKWRLYLEVRRRLLATSRRCALGLTPQATCTPGSDHRGLSALWQVAANVRLHMTRCMETKRRQGTLMGVLRRWGCWVDAVTAVRQRARVHHPRAAFIGWANWTVAAALHRRNLLTACAVEWLEVITERLRAQRGLLKHALRRWCERTTAAQAQRLTIGRWHQKCAYRLMHRAFARWELEATSTHGVDNDEILVQVVPHLLCAVSSA